MKAGWEIKKLGDVIQKTETVNPLNFPEYEFNYIDVSSVSNTTFQIEETQLLIGKDAPSRARRKVKENDVLFATIRPTLRRIAIVPQFLDEQVCSTAYFVLRPKKGIDHRYIFYWLFSEEFMGQMEVLQKGASYPAVTDAEVKAQLIPLPTISEQCRIVAILDEAFAGIAAAKEKAAQNLKNAKEVFTSYLKSIFADAWLNSKIVKLEDLATDITDGDHMPPPKTKDGVPFITIGNIIKNTTSFTFETKEIDFSETFMVSNEYFNSLKHSKRPVAGDILYTVTGSFGIPVLIRESKKFCFQRHIGLIRPKEKVYSEWLYYLLMSPQVVKQANEGATGTAQRTVSLSVLRNFQVPSLSLSKQKDIAIKVSDIGKETSRLESLYQQKLSNLEELKKSLLQQAFSGAL